MLLGPVDFEAEKEAMTLTTTTTTSDILPSK